MLLKRFCLALVLLQLICSQLKAIDKLDSLKNILNHSPSRSEEINIKNKIARLYINNEIYDSGFYFANNALNQSKRNNYKLGEADAYYNLGRYSISKLLFAQSSSYLLNARTLYDQLSNINGVADCNMQLGVISYNEKKYTDALGFFQNALKSSVLKTEPTRKARLSYLAGLCFTELGRYNEAEISLDTSLKIYEYTGLKENILETKYGLAELYFRKSDILKSKLFYIVALEGFLSEKNSQGISICKLGLGNIAEARGDYNEALNDITEAYNISRSMRYNLVSEKAAKKLSEIYLSKKDYANAYKYQNEYYNIRDSVQSADNMKAIANLESELELQKQEQKIELLNKEHDTDIRTRYILIGGGALLFLLSILLLNRYRFEHKAKETIRTEKKRSDDLLLNILPEETAIELKESGKAAAHSYEGVSVMFADIYSFTAIAATLPAEELVRLLDMYFRAFDTITEKYGLEKIKTIGDAFMCAGGLPVQSHDSVENTVKAAQAMQGYARSMMEEKKQKQEPFFEIRIGIHTGPVVAGVVGMKKFAYDIWGDTVNTAARMEQASLPGKINISDTTYDKIKDKFECKPRGKITVKNKGEVEMYFVEGINPQAN